ncbi:MAG: hypothetical protein Q8S09_02625, partial [Hyphomonas sp.]|nr:hypothetical protein [Hyphomonas sp.]
MPRARRRPVLAAPLAPSQEAALKAFADAVRTRGEAARAKRLSDGAAAAPSGDAGAERQGKAKRGAVRAQRAVRGRRAGLEAQ